MFLMLGYVGAIIFFLACFVGFLTMIFFGINRKKYERLVAVYEREGLYMNDFNQLAVYFGYFGSYFPTVFFYQLLKDKKIKIGKDTFAPADAYAFMQSLPRELTGWITVYYWMHFIWMNTIAVGGVMLAIAKLAGVDPNA
ncbi:hypothetical protein HF675_09865 [Serratia sp. JUb9]|nr:hypothetical protein [Serratia rubidaea]QNK34308.1 hypothetical protein HF675_09865 [Serratia sp. JUb9]